ncbi:MAG: hypothetical protein U5L45_02860 [Saprospiraceae bacterium]|nr:hypothetical protein [Saprospiraceae bacterium]
MVHFSGKARKMNHFPPPFARKASAMINASTKIVKEPKWFTNNR